MSHISWKANIAQGNLFSTILAIIENDENALCTHFGANSYVKNSKVFIN